MIHAKNLNKKYGKLKVLKNLDLHIAKGGIFSILGPNGSGKTTLIKCLLGLLIPESGEILLNSENIINKYSYRKNIDYLPQIANFPPNLKVNELIKMIKDLRNKETRNEELIKIFGLQEFLDKKLANLSGGTKQKVNLLLAFMFNSPIVILDEPTSGLDPIALLQLKKIILSEKANGKTIIITSHIMNFVEEMSDEIVFLLDGKIYFQGSISELKSRTQQKDLEHAIASILKSEND